VNFNWKGTNYRNGLLGNSIKEWDIIVPSIFLEQLYIWYYDSFYGYSFKKLNF
jgi:hypothetical protein